MMEVTRGRVSRSTAEGYIASHRETQDNFDSRLLSSPTEQSSSDFRRSISVTSPPPRNGCSSPLNSNSGRKTPLSPSGRVTPSRRSKSMADQQYLPTGYTKCDLTAKGKGPSFNIQNQRAWKNPTPTPWGKELVGTSYQQPSGSLGMSMDNSGVVGKFRSFYSTIEQVKQAFLQYDINRDGNISRKELEDGMSGSGQFSLEDARITFDKADINGDGEIDLAEFVQLMFPNAAEIISNMKSHFRSMDDVVNTFNSWDTNKDGSISFSELSNAVSHGGQRLSEEEMNAIFVVGDIDQNGEIDLEEFKRMMMPSASDVVTKFRSVHKTTKDVQAAFKRFDADGDGSIDKREMTQALTSNGLNFTQQEIG